MESWGENIKSIRKHMGNSYLRVLGYLILSTSWLHMKSQVSVPGNHFDAIDKNDTSIINFYQSITIPSADGITLLNPFVNISYNSQYPRSYNDGAVWKGRGTTVETHFGLQLKKGSLSVTLFPVAYFSQNQPFGLVEQRIASIDQNGYQLAIDGGIDWVQRYGEGSFFALHPGQSEIRLDLGKFTTAISTQNYSWGPSRFNPILMSRQAGGFPHIRLGFKPFDLNLGRFNAGKIEYNMIYGFLKESDYYDAIDNNNRRYFNSFSLSYQPSFLKGFKVGVNKVLYKQSDFFEFTDLISPFYIIDDGVVDEVTLSVNDTFDQLASFTFEWELKEANFRSYVEYAVNDFSGIIYIEPEHSRGLTIGFEKVIELKNDRSIRILYEHSNLTRSSSFLYRPEPPFYVHGINRQGYTNNGQILGAGIGPGANSDNLLVELLKSDVSFGVLFQRIESNKDYFIVNVRDKERHDQEYTCNLYYQKRLDNFALIGSFSFSYNFNRYYQQNQENLALSLGGSWIFNE